MKKKLCLLLFIVLLPLNIHAAEGLRFTGIKFYESSEDSPPHDSRAYANRFAKSKARYIWCEVNADNILYNIRKHDHSIVWRYYKPDGTLLGALSNNWPIKTEWATTWHQHGWGWDTAGEWNTGNYRVEVLVDNVYFGEGYFTIYEDRQDKTISFEKLQFFEGPEKISGDYIRRYLTEFSKTTARYIYYEVGIQNLLYNVRENPVKITAKYFKPDGTLMGSPELNYTIPKDWEDADLWHGWGWDTTGNWEPGKYRVELSYMGGILAQGSFSIKDTSKKTTDPLQKTISFTSLRFFESSFTPVEQSLRKYATRFSKAGSRYIFYEIYVKNLLYNVRANPVKLTAKYYKPDGTLFGAPAQNDTIPADWETTYLWNGWGWTDSGNWDAGTYRVEIYDGDTLLSDGYFTIAD